MNTIELARVAKFRRVKALICLFCAFVAASAMSGLLNPLSPLSALVNLSITLSMPTTAGVYASMNLFIMIFGILIMVSSFSSFSALEGSPVIILMGGFSIFLYLSITVHFLSGLTALALILPPVLLVRYTLNKLSYKNALIVNSAYYLALVLAPVGVYLYENRLEGATFSQLLFSNIPTFTENFLSYPPLDAYGLSSVPFTTGLSTEKTIDMLLNYVPALFVGFAVLCAFFATTYFVKNSGFLPIRLATVTKSFFISKAGAAFFCIAALSIAFATGVYYTVLYNFFIIMAFPLSLVGLNSIRKGFNKRGGFIIWILMFVFLLTMPFITIFYFLATIGSIETLIGRAQA